MPWLTKRRWKLGTEVTVFLAVTPIAWLVYSRASTSEQWVFVAGLVAVAWALRRWVYEPVLARLPEEEDEV